MSNFYDCCNRAKTVIINTHNYINARLTNYVDIIVIYYYLPKS